LPERSGLKSRAIALTHAHTDRVGDGLVYSGRGPETTAGRERRANPFPTGRQL
jgi:hypothetical protein